MKVFDKNPLKSSPDQTYLLTASAVLIPTAFTLFYCLSKKWNEVKKVKFVHSLLWISTGCFGFSGVLFLLLALLRDTKIVLTDSVCIDFSFGSIISIVGVASLFFWFIIISFRFSKWLLTEVRNRIGGIDDSPMRAIYQTTKELLIELFGYIKMKFRDKLREIKDKKKSCER